MGKIRQFRAWLARWWRGFSRKASQRHAATQMLDMEKRFKHWQKTGVFLVMLMLAGCASVGPEYVAADRATYDAVAEDWVTLQPDSRKAIARHTIKSWLARIEAAEKRFNED